MSTVHPLSPNSTSRTESILPSKISITDDFISNSTEIGEHGRIGWSSGGTGSVIAINSSTNHPGIIDIQAGGALNNNIRFHITSANNVTAIASANIGYVGYLVYFPALSGINIKLGVSDQIVHAWGTEGAWFSIDPSVSAGKIETNTKTGAGTETVTSTVTAAIATWYLLEMIRLADGTWRFIINGVQASSHTVRLPTAQMNIGISINNGDGAAVKDCYLDWFAFESTNMGNRY